MNLYHGGPRLQTAGGPTGAFDRVPIASNRPLNPGQRIETHYMSKADDLGGIGKSISEVGRPAEVTTPEESYFAVDGKIPPEQGFRETMRIREILRDFCQKLGIDIDKSNLSFAEVNVPGKPNKMISINTSKSLDGTIGMPGKPVFNPVHAGAQRRDVDAEYKILEEIVKGFEKGPDGPSGAVALYTEQIPCPPSCAKVIIKFREDFPNIKLEPSFSFKDKYERINGVWEALNK